MIDLYIFVPYCLRSYIGTNAVAFVVVEFIYHMEPPPIAPFPQVSFFSPLFPDEESSFMKEEKFKPPRPPSVSLWVVVPVPPQILPDPRPLLCSVAP